MKCIKKIDVETRSGAGFKKVPTCAHYESLLFLRDNVSNRETSSNLNNSAAVGYLQTPIGSPSPTNGTNQPIPTITTPVGVKRRKSDNINAFLEESKHRRQKMDELIEKVVATPSIEQPVKDDDADMLFCRSLAPVLRRLNVRSNMQARIEIQQVLMRCEFGTE